VRTSAGFVAVGLVVAVALALFASPYASSKPDGLNRVAEQHGFAGGRRQSATAHLPTARYGIRGVHDGRLSTGLAGLLGVLVVFGLCTALAAIAVRVRRQGRFGPEREGPPAPVALSPP
jgi:hypothetical protein